MMETLSSSGSGLLWHNLFYLAIVGTGLIPIKTSASTAAGFCGPVPMAAPPPIWAFGGATARCPIPDSAPLRAATKASPVPVTCTPNAKPPSGIMEAIRLSTSMRAPWRVAITCCPSTAPSPSKEYVVTLTRRPENRNSATVIAIWSTREMLRGATIASSLTLSRRSASAARWASAAPRCASAIRASAVETLATASAEAAEADATSASALLARASEAAISASYFLAKTLALEASSRAIPASLLAIPARSLAPAASTIASAAWRCAVTNIVLLNSWSHPSARDTQASNSPSPATPRIISTQPAFEIPPAQASSRCIGSSRLVGIILRSQRNLKISSNSSATTPIATIAVHHVRA
jgi:hypothetical protein